MHKLAPDDGVPRRRVRSNLRPSKIYNYFLPQCVSRCRWLRRGFATPGFKCKAAFAVCAIEPDEWPRHWSRSRRGTGCTRHDVRRIPYRVIDGRANQQRCTCLVRPRLENQYYGGGPGKPKRRSGLQDRRPERLPLGGVSVPSVPRAKKGVWRRPLYKSLE